jgi:hypothetical protein
MYHKNLNFKTFQNNDELDIIILLKMSRKIGREEFELSSVSSEKRLQYIIQKYVDGCSDIFNVISCLYSYDSNLMMSDIYILYDFFSNTNDVDTLHKIITTYKFDSETIQCCVEDVFKYQYLEQVKMFYELFPQEVVSFIKKSSPNTVAHNSAKLIEFCVDNNIVTVEHLSKSSIPNTNSCTGSIIRLHKYGIKYNCGQLEAFFTNFLNSSSSTQFCCSYTIMSLYPDADKSTIVKYMEEKSSKMAYEKFIPCFNYIRNNLDEMAKHRIMTQLMLTNNLELCKYVQNSVKILTKDKMMANNHAIFKRVCNEHHKEIVAWIVKLFPDLYNFQMNLGTGYSIIPIIYQDLKKINITHTEKCPVCLDKITDCSINCGHMFCYNCINIVFRTSATCPLCKKSITDSFVSEKVTESVEVSEEKN